MLATGSDLQLLGAGKGHLLLDKYRQRLPPYAQDSLIVHCKVLKAPPPTSEAAVLPWLLGVVKSCERWAALEKHVWDLADWHQLTVDESAALFQFAVTREHPRGLETIPSHTLKRLKRAIDRFVGWNTLPEITLQEAGLAA